MFRISLSSPFCSLGLLKHCCDWSLSLAFPARLPTEYPEHGYCCYIPITLYVGTEELEQNKGVTLETLILYGERTHLHEGYRVTDSVKPSEAKVVWYWNS